MVNCSPPIISFSCVEEDGHQSTVPGYSPDAATIDFNLDRLPVSSMLSPQNTLHSNTLSDLSTSDAPLDADHIALSMHSNNGNISSIVNAASSSGRRVRSGSLFSTNSIWNDDALSSVNSPKHSSTNATSLDLFPDLSSSAGATSFLSPNLGPQPSHSNMKTPASRNRSHTTSGGPFGPSNIGTFDATRLSSSPFQASYPDSSHLLDNFLLNVSEQNQTRNRAQTYSGVNTLLNPAIQSHMNGIPQKANPYAPTNPDFSLIGSMSLGQPALGSANVAPASSGAELSMVNGGSAKPFLQDDFNFAELSFTTSFDNPNLSPTNNLLIDNVPLFLDSYKLYQLLDSPSGVSSGGYHNRGILSVRVSQASNSKMALVVCPSVEIAMTLKANFNHLEIVKGVILYIAFAKVLEKSRRGSPENNSAYEIKESLASDQNTRGKSPESVMDQGVSHISGSLVKIASDLAGSQSIDLNKIQSILQNTVKFPKSKYEKNYGKLPDALPVREFDSPKLRELRKTLESTDTDAKDSDNEAQPMSQPELEALALAMLDELPELCYDHIGNTIIQKLFVLLECPVIKLILVKELEPYLTQLGIHKNGTWAIQKIINLCGKDDLQQKVLIAKSLKPFSLKLFNDQFGNYVLQCCLKFGTPYNDFIFETMSDNFLEISSGRFGARCIRTILETANNDASKNSGESYVSKEQLLMVASLIVHYANSLVYNSNGSLLITWFLDTFHGSFYSAEHQDDRRYKLLCDQFLPHLDKLCTHKLANLTVFKLLNNRTDESVKLRLLDEIFGVYDGIEQYSRQPTPVLKKILEENGEQNSGPLFIYKIVSNPGLLSFGSNEAENQQYQQFVIAQVKKIMLEMNVVNLQPYKKLIEEVGLSTNRMTRAPSISRKSKRNTVGRKNGAQGHYVNGDNMSAYAYSNNGRNMAPMGSFGAEFSESQAYNAYPNGSFPAANYNMYGAGPVYGAFQGAEYGYNREAYAQDANVMRQLEQLSLSSAAMGYASTPDTPKGNM